MLFNWDICLVLLEQSFILMHLSFVILKCFCLQYCRIWTEGCFIVKIARLLISAATGWVRSQKGYILLESWISGHWLCLRQWGCWADFGRWTPLSLSFFLRLLSWFFGNPLPLLIYWRFLRSAAAHLYLLATDPWELHCLSTDLTLYYVYEFFNYGCVVLIEPFAFGFRLSNPQMLWSSRAIHKGLGS